MNSVQLEGSNINSSTILNNQWGIDGSGNNVNVGIDMGGYCDDDNYTDQINSNGDLDIFDTVTFEEIFSRAKRFVFLAICTRPAIAVLPSGENAHCTLEPMSWWVEQIRPYSKVYTHIKTYGNDNNYEILNEDIYLEWFLEQL